MSQAEVFANQTRYYLDKLTQILNGAPNAIDMCLAQMLGTDGFAASLKAPDKPVQDVMAGVDADAAAREGVTAVAVLARFATFLQGSTVDAARQKIDQALSAILIAIQPLFGDSPPAQTQTQLTGGGAGGALADGGVLGNLIAAKESGGKYGAFNTGNAGDSGGKTLPFETMTLQEIQRRQGLRGGDPNRLNAVGKYQLIGSTLGDAIRALNVALTEFYAPPLQEKFFRQYLVAIKRPLIKKYIDGEIVDRRSALLELSREWAAVANPDTGATTLTGHGNKALITAAAAGAALDQERQAYSANIAAGMAPEDAWLALSFPRQKARRIDFAVGDSLAVGQNATIRSAEITISADNKLARRNGVLIAQTGASPDTINKNIDACLAADAGFFRNKAISLSTGASNDPDEIPHIADQIAKLQNAGAVVAVNGVSNNGTFQGRTGIGPMLNQQLQTIAKANRASFCGGYVSNVPDHIHRTVAGYVAMLAQAGDALG